MDVEKKSISELKVIDLKRELEARGLDKNGVKAALIQRLSKAMTDEGNDPESFLFEVGKSPTKGEESVASKASDNGLGDAEKAVDGEAANEAGDNTAGDEEALEGNNAGDDDDIYTELDDDEPLLTLNAQEDHVLDTEDDAIEDLGGEDNQDAYLEETKIDTDIKKDGEDVPGEDHSDAKVKEELETTTAPVADANKEDDEEKEVEPAKEEVQVKEEVPASEEQSAEGKTVEGDENDKSVANLWVSNLSSNTKATDLKRLFSRHGKLITAKIMTSARTPGARCYGYVTMANSDDADRCIEFLHKVELHSRIISVERAKDDATGPVRQHSSGRSRDRDRARSPRKDVEGAVAVAPKVEGPEGEAKPDDGKPKPARRSPRRRSPRKVLSFDKIKEERERQRHREQERHQRDLALARREREEEQRLRERERRQRLEAQRLEKEKQRLRQERERLEREKADLLRLERDRQRIERERIEREREELRNKRKTLTSSSRPVLAGSKRPSDDKREYSSKRQAHDKDLVEPPPAPRFSESDRRSDRYARSSDKYDRRSGKEESRSSSRYESSKDAGGWPSSNGSQYKTYGSSGYGSSRDEWAGRTNPWSAQESSSRWPTDSESLAARSYITSSMYPAPAYGSVAAPSMQPARYADPRYDAYAHSLPVRKY